jgi:hypothetical protein
MKTLFHRVDSAKMMVNGKLVTDAMMDTLYEGDVIGDKNKLTIDTYNKGERDHIELDNKDIMKILSQPASAMSLEKRLIKDFAIKTKTNKRKIHHNKRKTNNKRKGGKKSRRKSRK